MKTFGTLVGRINHPIALLSCANILSLISASLVNLIVAKYFSDESLSVFASLVNIINVALPLFEMGFSYTLSVRHGKLKYGDDEFCDNLVFYQFMSGMFLLVLFSFAVYVFNFGKNFNIDNYVLVICFMGCVAMSAFGTLKALAASRSNFSSVAKSTFTNSVLRLLFIGAVIGVEGASAAFVIFVLYFISPTITIFFGGKAVLHARKLNIFDAGARLSKFAWDGRWVIAAASLYSCILMLHLRSSSNESGGSGFPLIIVMVGVVSPIAEAFRTFLVKASNSDGNMYFYNYVRFISKYVPFWFVFFLIIWSIVFFAKNFDLLDRVSKFYYEIVMSVFFMCCVQILAMISLYVHRAGMSFVVVFGCVISLIFSTVVLYFYGDGASNIDRLIMYYFSLFIVEIVGIGALVWHSWTRR